MRTPFLSTVALAALLAALVAGCSSQSDHGTVRIDGSSTVFPISESVAEEFGQVNAQVRVTVGVSGTGGGFKKFVLGETDINDASRPIKSQELERAHEHGIEFIELPVAYDGLSVIVHPANDWVDHLTVQELKKIWQPGSTVSSWSDVRAGFPDRPIALYGPGTDSGTFDYFTEVINGKSQACRPDFTASEDDNVLVQGVVGDENSIGFFGYAYYVENKDRLKIVPIDNGQGPVAPSEATINDGTYAPLSRPIFIYVSKAAAQRPEVAQFVDFYLEHAGQLAAEVGYVAMPQRISNLVKQRFAKRIAGTVFNGAHGALEDLVATGL